MLDKIANSIQQMQLMRSDFDADHSVAEDFKATLEANAKTQLQLKSDLAKYRIAVDFMVAANELRKAPELTVGEIFEERKTYESEGWTKDITAVREHYATVDGSDTKSIDNLLKNSKAIVDSIDKDLASAEVIKAIDKFDGVYNDLLAGKEVNDIDKAIEDFGGIKDTMHRKAENIRTFFKGLTEQVVELKDHIFERASDLAKVASLKNIEIDKTSIVTEIRKDQQRIANIEAAMDKLTAKQLSRQPILNALHNVIRGDDRTLAEAGRANGFESKIHNLAKQKADLQAHVAQLSGQLVEKEKESLEFIRENFNSKEFGESALSKSVVEPTFGQKVNAFRNAVGGGILTGAASVVNPIAGAAVAGVAIKAAKDAVNSYHNADYFQSKVNDILAANDDLSPEDKLANAIKNEFSPSQVQALNMAEAVLPDSQFATLLNSGFSAEKMVQATSLYLTGYTEGDVLKNVLLADVSEQKIDDFIQSRVNDLIDQRSNLTAKEALLNQISNSMDMIPNTKFAEKYLDSLQKEALSEIVENLPNEGIQQLASVLQNIDSLSAEQSHEALTNIASMLGGSKETQELDTDDGPEL